MDHTQTEQSSVDRGDATITESQDVLTQEDLIEEVSIDGMCGVY